jgi:hypothetical protein
MLGSQFLLILLGIVAVAGLLALWFRSMMRKIAARWTSNTQLVNGTFSRFRAQLRGTYHGRPVMMYLGNEGGGDGAPKTYSYTVRMSVPPGSENWALNWSVPRKGEPAAWNLKAKPGQADQLTAAGLLSAVESASKNWHFRYRASSGRLELGISNVGMYFCPDTAAFQAQLDMLVRLAAVTQAPAGTSLLQAA